MAMMPDSTTDERGAMFVTADSQDPRFNEPYVDVPVWSAQPQGWTISSRTLPL
jgi:hypothetical protein